jgi:cytochrome c oxidase subunit 3
MSNDRATRSHPHQSSLLEHEAVLGRSQLGMLVFLASDVMLFAPFFAAYFLLRSSGLTWPPSDVTLDVPRTAIATAALIASSFTLVRADRAVAGEDLALARRWLGATMLLGGAFLTNQIVEYTSLDFRPSTHVYGSVYWLLTGLHSAHVTAGLLALGAVVVRTFRVATPRGLDTWAHGVSAFWHLVDVIWVAVFLTIWVVR